MTGQRGSARCFWWSKIIESIVQARFPVFSRYFLAVLISIGGVLLAALLKENTGIFGIPITILATVIAAIFGGLGPGILAALISAVSANLFLVSTPMPVLGLYGLFRIFVFSFISGLVGFLVSALRDSFARAEEAREEAERANSEKDAVIAFLSHDLRGPLSSISLSFQLIQKYIDAGHKEAEAKRLAANGVFFCRRMTQLIQNLLDASKIKSGGIKLLPGWNDLQKLLTEVVSEHRLLAEEKKLELVLEGQETGPLWLNCDQVLLSQVVANLLQNAIKFTPSGGRIRVLIRKAEGQLQVSVVDNGLGIPSAELPYIFERFWKTKKVTGEGAGLGLFLSRAIVEAHGGHIRVKSELGKGSEFTILLPALERSESVQWGSEGQVSLRGEGFRSTKTA
jgi:signal transduction histidine kinase